MANQLPDRPGMPDERTSVEIHTTDMPHDGKEPVPAGELYKQFDENYEELSRKYARKRFDVTGIASKVGPDVFGAPAVEVSDEMGGACFTLCVFPTTDILDEVVPGDKVVCRGNFLTATSQYGPVLKKCELLSAEPQ